MNGAPEGELYLANVLERFEVPCPGEPAADLEALMDQLAGRAHLKEWHEKFVFGDQLRGVVIHAGHIITPKAAKEVGLSLRRHAPLEAWGLCASVTFQPPFSQTVNDPSVACLCPCVF